MQHKILHVLPGLQPGGGISTFFMNYLRNIDHQRYTFDVICHGPYDENYKQEIESYGGKVTFFPNIGINNLYKSIRQAEKYFLNNKYDAVHCHMANAAFIYLKLAKDNNIPLRIMHSHQDHYADRWTHALRNIPIVKLGKRYSNCNIACSQQAGNFLFPKKNYTILRNSIPLNEYHFDIDKRENWRKKHNADGKIIFANIGRHTRQKNQTFVLATFAQIAEHYSNAELYMVGDGELRRELEQYGDLLHLSKRIHWTGNINNMTDLYQGIDFLIFPSIYEGLPLTLIEAQAAGVQCYASDQISTESLVSDFIQMLPITQGIEPWMEAIQQKLNTPTNPSVSDRRLGAKQVKAAGFDIVDTVHDLERIYSSFNR